MIPQKQGTAQFIGSSSRGSIVSLAWAGSNVSSGVSVAVGEGVSVGKLTIPVGVDGSVSVLTGVRIEVAIVGTVANCVGCIVGLTGVHPARARTGIKKRDSKENGFIFKTFSFVLRC
jgi:hypothetical protein